MARFWKRFHRDGGPAADAAVPPLLRVVHREVVLLTVLAIIAAVAFAGTSLAARNVRALRSRDAAAWHTAGLDKLEAGRTADAAAALRRAVALAPDESRYQLALARALAIDGHPPQARQVLLRLRERHPEDPAVNLALARLEAGGGDPATTIRYYQHALAALWSDTQNEIRPKVRLELIEFLLHHGQRSRALSELLVLSPTVPSDAPTRAKLGWLFLQAEDSARAADQFALAIRRDPGDASALTGAAEAAFNQGQYARARRLLALAPAGERVSELRAIVELVFSRDPLASRLHAAARRDRLLANIEHVAGRLTACEHAADLRALRPEVDTVLGALRGRRSIGRDAAEDGMDLVARAELAIGDACGPTGALDRALLLIARRYELRAP